MKEWVKKEEGVSFGETSEQQPTGYAAHSDHNGRCNPCVGEGVLLVVVVFVLRAIPFLLFYDRTVLPLCNRCLPRQECICMPTATAL